VVGQDTGSATFVAWESGRGAVIEKARHTARGGGGTLLPRRPAATSGGSMAHHSSTAANVPPPTMAAGCHVSRGAPAATYRMIVFCQVYLLVILCDNSLGKMVPSVKVVL
jgi:hypothetical protein